MVSVNRMRNRHVTCRVEATMSELYSLIEDEMWPARPQALEARPVVAHLHGRWTATATRERAILSSFARRVPVFVLEPPVFADDVAIGRLDVSMPAPNVWRAVPRLPSELLLDEEETHDRVRHFAQQMVGASAPLAPHFPQPVQWFFTPMPAPKMLGGFGEIGVVYDCVDERTWVRLAPREAKARERKLLAHTDVVFASEGAAHRAKSLAHANLHIVRIAEMEGVVQAGLAVRTHGARLGLTLGDRTSDARVGFSFPPPARDQRLPEPYRQHGNARLESPASDHAIESSRHQPRKPE